MNDLKNIGTPYMYRFVDECLFYVLYNTLVDNEIWGQVYDGRLCGLMTNENSLNVLSSTTVSGSSHKGYIMFISVPNEN